jgi:nitroreductase
MQAKPAHLPMTQVDGKPLKPLPQVLLERRATQHFKPDEVPEEFLKAMLELAAQAPSGYNLQPWRFIVVREREARERLQKAAFNQAKVSEAPVVIIALGMKEDWKRRADAIFAEGAQRGAGDPQKVEEAKAGAFKFLSTLPMDVWVTRHTMIAFMTLLLVAEAYGFDTAPMEGFDAAAVKREFSIPDEAEVVALLAIGRAQEPDKAYPGRLPLREFVYQERFGQAWAERPERD